MSKRKGYKRLTQQEFDLIKSLLQAGYKTKGIIELTGRTASTVNAINRHKTIAEYLEYKNKAGQKKSATKVSKDSQLDRIEKKLDHLIDIWTKPSSKKGIFKR